MKKVYYFGAEANKRLEVALEEVEALRARNAWLEVVAEQISQNCKWREVQLCDLNCRGREFCKTEGLNPFLEGATMEPPPCECNGACVGQGEGCQCGG